MIEIKDKKDCCGCSACVQICPKDCIRLAEDEEGFLYPHVDRNSCIGCGLCEKVCPVINAGGSREPLSCYAAKNRDERIRMESSSGGIFTLLAENIVDEGGVVFGARFDDKWEVVHDFSETSAGLAAFRGSKYVQSRIGNTFRQAESFLKEGRKVLFSGTPCQIKALKLYLRKDYDNLLTVDFICHGVPSPGVWRQYLDETFRKPDRRDGRRKNTVLSSPEDIPVITGISFRDKQSGWKKYSFVVRGKSAGQTGKNTVLLSDMHQNNVYMKAFLSDLILRPSCYDCRAKGGRSGSDITIADFWGIQNVLPEFDDDKGVNAVMINSGNGEKILSGLKVESHSVLYTDVLQYNPSLESSAKKTENRDRFFSNKDKPVQAKVKRYCRKNIVIFFSGIILKVSRLVKHIQK